MGETRFYESVLNTVQDGIWVTDAEDRIVFFNTRMEAISGMKAEAALGLCVTTDFPEETTGQFLPHYRKAKETLEPVAYEAEVVTPAGLPMVQAGWLTPRTGNGRFAGMICSIQDTTQKHAAEEQLKAIEWMLRPGKKEDRTGTDFIPAYGDISEIAEMHEIRDAVGREMLEKLVYEFLDLLGTSAAVYEKNGDYALGIFSSDWCRFLDTASRGRCTTPDNREALHCRKWHCHESCWRDASKTAMDRGEPADVACAGGLHIYAIPVFAGEEIVGAINFGYGDPPRDEARLREIAALYGVSAGELRKYAAAYATRPPFIIDIARQRLETTARIIGEAVSRRRAEDALRESEGKHRLLFETMAQGVVFQARDGSIISANPSAERILGLSLCQMQTKTSDDAVWDAVREDGKTLPGREHPAMAALHTGKSVESFIMGVRHAETGKRVWISVSAIPLFVPGAEEPFQVYSTFSDITRRKETEDALRESEERLSSLYNSMLEGICLHELLHDPAGKPVDYRILDVNPAYEKITGLSREKVTGRLATEIYGEEKAPYLERYVQVARTEQPERFETYYEKLDKYFLITAFATEEGKFATLFLDITDRKAAEEALKQQSHILDQGADAIYVSDVESRLVYVNSAAAAYTGYTRERLLAMRIGDIDPEFDAAAFQEMISQLEAGEAVVFRSMHRRADARSYPVELSLSLIEQPGQRLVCAIARDMTEQEEKEISLKRTQFSVDSAPISIFWISPEGQFNYVNEKAAASLGYTREELLHLGVADVDPNHPGDVRPDRWRQYKEAGEAEFESLHLRKDGTTFPVRVNSYYMEFMGREMEVAEVEDITERKAAEEVLRERENYLKKILSTTADGFWVVDTRARITDVNGAYCRMSGYSREEILGMSVSDIDADESEALRAERMRCISTHGHLLFETRHRRKDGSLFDAEISVSHFEGRGADGIGFVCFIRDITRRKAAEMAVRESEERFEQMLAVVPDMISIHDPQMNILYSNWQGFAAVPEERRNRNTKCYHTYRGFDTICPDCRAKAVMESAAPFREETELPDGRWVDLRIIPLLGNNGQVKMFMEWVRDITDRKAAEAEQENLRAQLTQAQKMEAVGRLAGGVAHDFNNMLNVILGNAELMLDGLPETGTLHAELEEIQHAAQRSADLTRQLLAFARRQTIAPKVLDLNETIESMLRMLRRLIGEDIDLLWNPGDLRAAVYMDPAQLDQILANLAVNARDAIGGVGKMSIETGFTEIDEGYCDAHPDFLPGSYVLLVVSDDGKGMDEETKAQIFEPFFTTKDTGEGTGLGLATVYGIVRQNQGFIHVYSEVEEGTAFRVYLPVYQQKKNGLEQKKAAAGRIERGSETILLIEDEPAILKLGAKMLETLGYHVLAAARPGEALQLAEEHAGEIHLLITDVVMPEMNGREIAKRLLALYPDMKRIFMSGYTANVIAHRGVLDEGVNFIQKPFTREALSRKVREVLEAES
jgi:two-component system, cell cycle sensor histidine kinase and response regulator CckA